VRSWSAW